MDGDCHASVRQSGPPTVHSISDISPHQRLKDNNEENVAPRRMLEELHADNIQLAFFLRRLHKPASATVMLPRRACLKPG
jgi:starvation-inducible DNA-binding protein